MNLSSRRVISKRHDVRYSWAAALDAGHWRLRVESTWDHRKLQRRMIPANVPPSTLRRQPTRQRCAWRSCDSFPSVKPSKRTSFSTIVPLAAHLSAPLFIFGGCH
ncbi:hypothetical protein RB195_017255 [Necator americanus]|uniref:Uncharacterized protein n=1 Tax=Necator americanus TaxID=51031 RepID=A0ABR1C4F2_NECAM